MQKINSKILNSRIWKSDLCIKWLADEDYILNNILDIQISKYCRIWSSFSINNENREFVRYVISIIFQINISNVDDDMILDEFMTVKKYLIELWLFNRSITYTTEEIKKCLMELDI